MRSALLANRNVRLSSLCMQLIPTLLLLPTIGFAQNVSVHDLIPSGTGSFKGAGAAADGKGPDTPRQETDRNFRNITLPRAASAPTSPANPPNGTIVPTITGNLGFVGLNHFDQRTAGTGAYTNTQFSLEPPDQAFCVGNGFAVESVNTAIRVFSASTGAPLTPVMALNQFFNLKPEFNRVSGRRGDFTSDPKCLYDSQTNRFFLTVLQADVNPETGDFTGPSSVLIAVTKTGDPTGTWSFYKINTTNDGTGGTPKNPNCPCLGDQPLIGLNEDGFFISTNEFPQFVRGFNGTQLYALSKTLLANSTGMLPKVAHINVGNIPAPDGGIWYTLQPAVAPPNAPTPAIRHAEFFLSALDFDGTLDNRIATWSLTKTDVLATSNPSAIRLTFTLLGTETYGQPPNARQPTGPGNFQPQMISTNDDRMNQVVFAAGKLYGGVNTILGTGVTTRAGIAYFVVTPSVKEQQVSAVLSGQGYVSAENRDVYYPSIGVNNSGKGLIGYSLSGPDNFPSAAYSLVDSTGFQGPITISKAGVGPEDGFTGASGAHVSRWGDYSASFADELGNVWFATECIPTTKRTVLANWGTYITRVTP